MSDDRIMTQASSVNKKKTVQHNNNGTQKAPHKRAENIVTMKGKAVQPADTTNSKERQEDITCIESQPIAPVSPVTECARSQDGSTAEKLTNMNNLVPENGHNAISVDCKFDKRGQFTKQQSEASSSGATAEMNTMNESMVTNESSLANKSIVTSISVATERSGGVQSGQSVTSNASDAIIQADGVESICKFYAKRADDKKKCLLRDVAITDDGIVLITDSKNRNIKLFTVQGEYIRSISHPDLKDPYGIAVLGKSKFVVSDCKGKDLKIFTLEGELVEKVGRNLVDYPMKAPTGLAINSKGQLVVSDSSRKCVYVYPIKGVFCDIIWGEAGLKPLQFKNPRYVGVTKEDDIIVSDYFSKKIAVFDAQTHDLKFTYGNKSEDRKLSYPRGVATDMEGNILIADNYNGKIQHVNGDEGNFIQFVYGDKHSIHRVRAVACDNTGHMVVLGTGGKVKIFDISRMHAKPPSDKGEDETLLHALFKEPEHHPDASAPQTEHTAQ